MMWRFLQLMLLGLLVVGQNSAPKPATKKTTTSKKSTSKSSSANNGNLLVQPQFASQMTMVTQPFSQGAVINNGNPAGNNITNLTRGYMTWDPALLPPGYTQAAVVKFLFNPSQVYASYSIGNSSMQSSIQFPSAEQQALPTVGLSAEVTFTLLFDRTYEMNGYSSTWPAEYNTYGCEIDVLAMKQFTGMFINSAAQAVTGVATPTGVNANTSNWNSPIPQGLEQMQPSYIYFAAQGAYGGVTTNVKNQNPSGIRYYGYIDSWDVNYTHFTQYMVPMRCAVDVSMTLLPPPAKSNASGKTTGTATQLATTPGGILPTPSGGGTTPITGGNPGPIIRGRLGR